MSPLPPPLPGGPFSVGFLPQPGRVKTMSFCCVMWSCCNDSNFATLPKNSGRKLQFGAIDSATMTAQGVRCDRKGTGAPATDVCLLCSLRLALFTAKFMASLPTRKTLFAVLFLHTKFQCFVVGSIWQEFASTKLLLCRRYFAFRVAHMQQCIRLQSYPCAAVHTPSELRMCSSAHTFRATYVQQCTHLQSCPYAAVRTPSELPMCSSAHTFRVAHMQQCTHLQSCACAAVHTFRAACVQQYTHLQSCVCAAVHTFRAACVQQYTHLQS